MTTPAKHLGGLLSLVPFLLFGTPQAAWAQGRGEPIAQAVMNAYSIASAEAPRAIFTAELGQLARAAQSVDEPNHPRGATAQFDQQYRRTRRSFSERGPQPSEALLDAWDHVVVAWHRIERRAPPPPIAEAPRYLQMQMRVDGRDVLINATSPDELFGACQRQMPSGRVVEVAGQRVARSRRPLGPSAICSIGVLTARSTSRAPELLHGNIGDIPFVLYGPLPSARSVVARYIPLILAETSVRGIDVEGRRAVRWPRFSAQEVVQILDAELLRRGPPPS